MGLVTHLEFVDEYLIDKLRLRPHQLVCGRSSPYDGRTVRLVVHMVVGVVGFRAVAAAAAAANVQRTGDHLRKDTTGLYVRTNRKMMANIASISFLLLLESQIRFNGAN